MADGCTCIPCQIGLAVACEATERRIRADERARLRARLDLAVDGGQLVRLLQAFDEPRMRRAAGLLVHTVRQVLHDDDA